jgi:hypothetical protein
MNFRARVWVVRHLTLHPFAVFVLCLTLVCHLEAKQPVSRSMPAGAKLYIAPMDWNLDRFVTAEIRTQGLPMQVVAHPAEADFVMTGLYQSLGSHLISPGHCIQVRIVSADDRKQEVWFAETYDYAIFFGRLRHHGPGRAAKSIVNRMRADFSTARRPRRHD